MILFNIWHYLVLGVILLIFIGGVAASLQQKDDKMKYSMLFSTALISAFLAVFSVFVVDKYTKKVTLSKMQNKRLLSTEKIIYTGIVTNVGNYPIGKVTFDIKLVNKGHATGNVKGGNFYKPNGIMSFFSSGLGMSNKPQTIEKEFIVAKNLKPGESKRFRVYFDYPPYFSSTAQFAKVWGH
ncbi:DUF2393 family protein [Sulfurimonas paralvinellae]|uniref:DUF2393 domain-containing protein n=1 Tax=Sulfurimonas paralvinellae TaxID=317658 RepID=A0A7M1B9J9_9BACT|nr:DUF2393 family protein [Sulfurimonas paralvinellae]QOP46390.1 DUF2393 domain-containing protein [Sulfurimonas paralvinellae]